jgi:hypothetical protein
VALFCSPDAKLWSPSGCETAQSVVAQNGAIYARLPNPGDHDRVCKHQYEVQKSYVENGIAKMHERNAKQAERARLKAERDTNP